MELEKREVQTLPQPKKNWRWTVVIWLIIGGLINYLDRANLSIAAPEMMKDLKLSNTDIGLFGTLFSWSYALMQLPAGWLIDRFGAKKMYAISLAWWSIATMLTGAVNKISSFVIARLLLGVGEAPGWPAGAKMTSFWFPKKERAFATGLWDSASKWGPAIAPPILVAIMVAFGWRALFYITGAVGVVFALLFVIFYRNPDKSNGLSKEEFAYIQAEGAGTEESLSQSKIKWAQLFKYKSMWGMILGFFCTIWIWNIFLVFLPLYLVKSNGVSLQQLGFLASIPWLGGVFGAIFGGYLIKRLVDRNIASPIKAKRILISVCAVLTAIVVILVPFFSSLGIKMTLMTLALCFISAITGSAWALAGDIAPPSMVASVGSIQNFGGYFGGAFSPIIAGIIVDRTDSYSLAFISGGIIAGCAALCYWFLVKDPIEEPIINE
ncbi:MFS transporter [Metabacillus sp. RGM 3146]|uniref:MFS transporter n=1 Tax=Metabacillus sp. RGM 3146 TaxID=3401092 RepID=UPI003B9AF876